MKNYLQFISEEFNYPKPKIHEYIVEEFFNYLHNNDLEGIKKLFGMYPASLSAEPDLNEILGKSRKNIIEYCIDNNLIDIFVYLIKNITWDFPRILVEKNNIEFIKLYVNQKKSTSSTSEILKYIVEQDNLSLLKDFMQIDFNIYRRDKEGHNALDFAFKYNKPEIIDYLLSISEKKEIDNQNLVNLISTKNYELFKKYISLTNAYLYDYQIENMINHYNKLLPEVIDYMLEKHPNRINKTRLITYAIALKKTDAIKILIDKGFELPQEYKNDHSTKIIYSYEFQKWFLENHPDRLEEIKKYICPEIEEEYKDLLSGNRWGLY